MSVDGEGGRQRGLVSIGPARHVPGVERDRRCPRPRPPVEVGRIGGSDGCEEIALRPLQPVEAELDPAALRHGVHRTPASSPRGYTRMRWICTSSGRWLPRPSVRPWMACWVRPNRVGREVSGDRASRGIPRGAATRRGRVDLSCSRRSTRSRTGSAGSANPPSTTSRGAWRSRLRRRTAWPRSTPSMRQPRDRRSWPTSATTSRAGSPGRRGSVTTSPGRSVRRGRRRATVGSAGTVRPVLGCATSRRRP